MKILILNLSVFCILMFFSCKPNGVNNLYKIQQTNNGIFDTIRLIDKNNIEILEININNNGTIINYTIKDSGGFQFDVNIDESNFAGYWVSYRNDFSNSANFTNGIINGYSINSSSGLQSAANLNENNIVSYIISDGNNYSNITNLFDENDEYILERNERINKNNEYIEIIYRNGLVKKEKWINNN